MAFGLGFGLPRQAIRGAGVAPFLSPDELFEEGAAYGWAIVAPDTVWADTAGTVPGVVNQTIRRLDDQRGDPWIGVTTGPNYRVTGDVHWLEFAQVDGRQLNITVPAITGGTLMVAHKNAGVMSGNVTIPAGTYSIGRWDAHGIVGILLIDRDLSQAEREQARQWFIDERGAGVFSSATSFFQYARFQGLVSVDLFGTSSATNFQGFLFGNQLTTAPLYDVSSGTIFQDFLRLNQLTTAPLYDVSSGTNFQAFLYANQLTSVPLFDTSSGTNFSYFLGANPLTTVPAGLFDDVKGTNFANAFIGCALTQQSVDNVLVSVATAANANNLNNGTLNLDSGTNAAPSTAGQAAIDDLVARGWTVTTN